MRLEDVVEGIVGHVEEGRGAQGEDGDEGVAAHALAQRLPAHIGGAAHAGRDAAPGDVDGDDEGRHQVGHGKDTAAPQQHTAGVGRMRTIDAGHACGEEPYQQQDAVLAYGGERHGHQVFGEAQTHHEVDDGRRGGEEEAAGHALAVEHEEEGQIDQCRPCLALHDDEHHGQQDDGRGSHERPHVRQRHAEAPDVARYGQGGGALGKLGRLQAHGAEAYPRPRALDVLGQKGRDDEQGHHEPVGHARERLEVAVVGHEEDETQRQGQANPYHLLARARRPGQEVRIAQFVAGAADAHPSEGDEGQIEHDGQAIGMEGRIAKRFI